MKNISIAFFILFGISANAQTPETKFLKKENINWAAFISDTVRFSSPNLSLEIRKQADAKKIKVVAPNIYDHIYRDQKLTAEEIDYSPRETFLPFYDSLGNSLSPIPAPPPKQLFDTSAFDRSTNDLIYAEQFLYLDKNILRSHISWVSPVKKVFTGGGTYIGNTYLFNVYHNRSEKISKRTRRKSVALGRTRKIISDSSFTSNMIKQWFGEFL